MEKVSLEEAVRCSLYYNDEVLEVFAAGTGRAALLYAEAYVADTLAVEIENMRYELPRPSTLVQFKEKRSEGCPVKVMLALTPTSAFSDKIGREEPISVRKKKLVTAEALGDMFAVGINSVLGWSNAGTPETFKTKLRKAFVEAEAKAARLAMRRKEKPAVWHKHRRRRMRHGLLANIAPGNPRALENT